MNAAVTANAASGRAVSTPIRVLIVDDSAVIRGLIARAIERDPALAVVGTAMHGEAALAWLERHDEAGRPGADVVVMDVEMPVMDGITALDHLQRHHPRLPVIMASSLTQEGAATTMTALARGAVGCVAKPAAANAAAAIDGLSSELVSLLKAVAGRTSAVEPRPSRFSAATMSRSIVTPQVVLIGASTGGPKALSTVLTGLGVGLALPVVIVQHMPPSFTPLLAKHLQADSGRPTAEAVEGGELQAGHTYVAPGGFHLTLERRDGRTVTLLNQDPPEHFCRPSVNPLFRSAARGYGSAALGVMLTGMGGDGLEGARDIVEAGGRMIVQDEATSVVWGMPAAIARAGLAELVLPLGEIASAVRRLCRTEPMSR